MSSDQKPASKMNLIHVVLCIGAMLIGIGIFVAPARDVPAIRNDISELKVNIAVQAKNDETTTETLRNLADATKQIARVMEELADVQKTAGENKVELKSHDEQLKAIWRKLDAL